jgi:1-acyl-sn-glycerol-3-phosphate acyltransferase
MNTILRYCFFRLIVKPIIILIIGLNIRHRRRLPVKGPAIIVANHNSHLDTMVLMSLFPAKVLKKVHPVAAADYFLKNKFIAWFSLRIIGIIPIKRKRSSANENPFKDIQRYLEQQQIVIYFPEGTRGEPEQMVGFKKGIAHLAKYNPKVPVYPIFMHGLGKSLPKDESLLVPFVVDMVIGDSICHKKSGDNFMQSLEDSFEQLKAEIPTREWE